MIYIDPEWNLVTDGALTELHAFAKEAGLRRKWFNDNVHFPHYRLESKDQEHKVIRMGAVKTTKDQVVRVAKGLPYNGLEIVVVPTKLKQHSYINQSEEETMGKNLSIPEFEIVERPVVDEGDVLALFAYDANLRAALLKEYSTEDLAREVKRREAETEKRKKIQDQVDALKRRQEEQQKEFQDMIATLQKELEKT